MFEHLIEKNNLVGNDNSFMLEELQLLEQDEE